MIIPYYAKSSNYSCIDKKDKNVKYFKYESNKYNIINIEAIYINKYKCKINIQRLKGNENEIKIKLFFQENIHNVKIYLDYKPKDLILDLPFKIYAWNTKDVVSESLIPKKIFQTYGTNNIPAKYETTYKLVRDKNPEYEYHFYDDERCKKLLYENFGTMTLHAFNILKPGAFKADLWRYAVLYVYGGVYIDIDLVTHIPLRDIIPKDINIYLVKDKDIFGINYSIYQAIIACRKADPIIKKVLEKCVSNIIKRKYGRNPFDITGPTMFGRQLKEYIYNEDKLVVAVGQFNLKGYELLIDRGNGHNVRDIKGRLIFTYQLDDSISNYHFEWLTKKVYF